jgi:hypothetical protein
MVFRHVWYRRPEPLVAALQASERIVAHFRLHR